MRNWRDDTPKQRHGRDNEVAINCILDTSASAVPGSRERLRRGRRRIDFQNSKPIRFSSPPLGLRRQLDGDGTPPALGRRHLTSFGSAEGCN
jgi:hypothetical protein